MLLFILLCMHLTPVYWESLRIPGPVPGFAGVTMRWTQPSLTLSLTLCSRTSGEQEYRDGKHLGA